MAGVTNASPGAGTSFPPRNNNLSSITLPLNNSVSQLATLSHSNHTLSPYARGHEHIAVRSFPHLGRSNTSASLNGLGLHTGRNTNGYGLARSSTGFGGGGRGGGGGAANAGLGHGPGQSLGNGLSEGGPPGKGRRKRIYRLGKSDKNKRNQGDTTPLSPDLDDTPPHSQSLSSGESQRRLSLNSAPMINNFYKTQFASQPSLTGMAQKVMRPNMARSPASRTSYGFPDTPDR